MSALDPSRHASLELLLAGACLGQRLGAEAPAFLAEYAEEFRVRGGWSGEPSGWRERLWREASARPELPLVRLAASGAGRLGIELLALVALAAEDGRIAGLLGAEGFTAIATLVALWRAQDGVDRPQPVRETIGWLIRAGLLAPTNPAAPHHAREVAVTDAAWALLGGGLGAAEHRLLAPDALPRLADLVLPDAVAAAAWQAARLLAAESDTLLWLRGPQDNGRRTLALAIGAELGRPAIATRFDPTRPEALRDAALAAFLADATLVIEAETAPGATLLLTEPPVAPIRTIVVTGRRAALAAGARPVWSLDLPLPSFPERLVLWRRAAPGLAAEPLADLAEAFRVTSGALVRAAAAAQQAGTVDRGTVRRALRDLLDGRLDAVAERIDTGHAAERLTLADAAQAELDDLVMRCRHREKLADHVGHGSGAAGVRALLAGPSGTGKSLAARCLARRTGKDLWRIDLAATVSKYIGETEKTLDRAFAAAEECDIVLLLDEGDALMARRTDVGSANDRYANLETNFLLQRIESFSGILIVTTNAADRIDPAFQRRMDAVVHFALPDELARYDILLHHLGAHGVGDTLLQEIAVRCTLSGGQLRNVALHARLLALDGDGRLGDRELRRAVDREYRKLAGFCPLRPPLSAVR